MDCFKKLLLIFVVTLPICWPVFAGVSTGASQTGTATFHDDVDWDKLEWCYGGFTPDKSPEAKVQIGNLSIGSNSMTYEWVSGSCETLGAGSNSDYSQTIACLFVRKNGKWKGGKFDWISTSRTKRDFTNVRGGYRGWDTSAIDTAEEYAFVIVSKDGKSRSNVTATVDENAFSCRIAVPADYDGDGKADVAVYSDDGSWLVYSMRGVWRAEAFGFTGCKPVPADYDGDAKDDIAVYDENGNWYILGTKIGPFMCRFGTTGSIPVPADYDGDGTVDIAVWEPNTGKWYAWLSRWGCFFESQFGYAGCTPVPADYDGDGTVDIAVWEPNTGKWYAWLSRCGCLFESQFGFAGCTPIPADYDGDGVTDIAVRDDTNGIWHIYGSGTGYMSFVL